MNKAKPDSEKEPSITQTLISDFKSFRHEIFAEDVKQPISRSFRDLRDFYLNEERRARLNEMGVVKRWLYSSFWLFKAMLLKLPPVRRVVLVIGIFFLLRAPGSGGSSDSALIGGVLLLLVLMFELKDKLLARSELQEGHAVQKALLPPRQPSLPGWDIWMYYQAANEVGGDLLDFQIINGKRCGIALGDVADKGLKAALLMAKLQATVRAFAADYDSLAALMTKVNQISCRDGLPRSFASLFYLELQQNSGAVRYVNAGHMPAYLIGSAGVRELAKGELALGLSPGAQYSEHAVNLQRGDVLFIYSDGLTEARNESGTFYGEERLRTLLQDVSAQPAFEIGERIINDVQRFVGAAARTDDLTVTILRVL